MKTKIFLALSMVLLLMSCKKQNNDNTVDAVVQDDEIIQMPNKSDIYFSEAISTLENNDFKKASSDLKNGIEALKKEGRDSSGSYNPDLQTYISNINKIADNLLAEKVISLDALKEDIVNAELFIAHNYLTSSDVYVLEDTTQVSNNKTTKYFNKALSNLKKRENKWNTAEEKNGKVLLDQGKKLEKELKEWQQKANAYNNKVNEHFKQYNPEYYEDIYWVN